MMSVAKLSILFWILHFLFGIIGVFSHGMGIYAIVMYKKKSNQTLILLNICVTELWIIVCGFVINTYNIYPYTIPKLMFQISYCIEMIFIMNAVLVMFILTLDRLICGINPLKYKLRMTRPKLKVMFLVSILISTIIGLLGRAFLEYETLGKWMLLITFISSALYILFSIVAYSIIIAAIRKAKMTFASSTRNASTNNSKQYSVPGLIILTFVVFYLIPFPFRRLLETDDEVMIREICRILQDIGCFVDPLIFVLLTSHYRKIIFKCFNCYCIGFNEENLPDVSESAI